MSADASLGGGSSLFAAVLRREREAAGLTQAALAERAGIGVRTVSNLERGINTAPYPNTVRLLAEALGLPEDARGALHAAAGRRQPGAPATGGYLGAVPPTRIVARDTERAAITAALDAAAAGAGRVVLLGGEAGIGKTRLAQEAYTYAEERGFVVASGRCFEEQIDTPFVPLLEVFSTLYDAAPPSLRESLAERWPALVAVLPDQLRTAPAPPLELSAPEAAQALHRAATAFLREVSEHRPVALLVDDLHWADDASVEMLTHLARTTASDRVFVLGAYRDGEVGSAHPVRRLGHALHRERMTDVITVDRFDAGTTARLVAQRLDEAPVDDALIDLVHRHSEGNPFFTVEILSTLLVRGDVTRVGDRWVCREVAVEAPAQVSELIAERVARLAPPAQEVLRAASVLGSVFDLDDISTIEVTEDLLESALEEAVDAGLLTIEEDRYAFDHSLTQQALYAALSPVRRRRLHRAVGERLESRPPAWQRRRAAEVARHLEAGGLPERAVPFVLLAGDVAAGAFASAEAVRLYGHGYELAEEAGDGASASDALERLGQVELMSGHYDEAAEHLLAAAERHRRTRDLEARLRVEGMIADLQHRRGEGEAAARRLDEVLAELDGTEGSAAGGAALANGLARVRIFLGQHELCVEAFELARKLARQADLPLAEAEACAVGGTALFFLDRPDEATRVLEEGVALAARINAPAVESGVLLGLQWATTMSGEFARSLELGVRGLELTRRAGNTDLESQHAAGLGRTLFYLGDHEQAEQHLERSLELTRRSSPTLFSGIPPVYLGVLRAAQGDAAAALACYDEAAGARDLQSFAFGGYLQARRAELDLAAGDPAAALARLEPWLADERPTGVHDASILVVAAEACLALADAARAEQLAEHALRRATATNQRVEEVDARRVLGRVRALGGDEAEARACWTEALELAVGLGYSAAERRVRAELS